MSEWIEVTDRLPEPGVPVGFCRSEYAGRPTVARLTETRMHAAHPWQFVDVEGWCYEVEAGSYWLQLPPTPEQKEVAE